jgi:hypothetical protein
VSTLWSRAFALTAVLVSLPTQAGTMIESRDDVGGSSTVSIEGDHVRIDSGNDSGYMLIDMKKHKVFSVSNDDHMVIDASSPVDTGATGAVVPAPTPTVTKVGGGPNIAGYPTDHYKISIGDQHCFDEYLASKPLEIKDVKNFTEMMANWSREQRKYAGGMFEDEDECDTAESALTDQYSKLGIPMRSIDSAGTVIHEITRIQTGQSFPASIFTPPKEYPVVTQQELLKRMEGTPDSDFQGNDPDQLEEMQQNLQELFDQMQRQE